MADDLPESGEQESPASQLYGIKVPRWHYAWALVQVALAIIVMPVFFEIILTQGSELTVSEVPLVLIMGIGFGVACVYAVVTNTIFLWRSLSGKIGRVAGAPKAARVRVKPIYWSAAHVIVGIFLILVAIVVLELEGTDIFREIPLVGIFGIIAFFGYAGTLFVSGGRGIYFQRSHLPHTKLGTGFRGLGIILVVALPVAGISTLVTSCNSSITFPAGVTIAQDLFSQGDNGYNTYKIPCLCVAPNGTIIAFCEGRRTSSADEGDNQIIMRKSYDNGATWTPMQILVNADISAVQYVTAGNPCALVDSVTRMVWLLYCLNNLQVFVINSSDNGETWSSPRNITVSVVDPSWDWVATGPGHGLQLASGRLYAPTDHFIGNDQYCGGIYSDDHGATWHLSQSVTGPFEEAQAAQLPNGTIILFMRSDSGINDRVEAWSNDNGTTWSAPVYDQNLPCPSCEGSIIQYTSTAAGYAKNRLLMSCPANPFLRQEMTIRMSYDGGQTWVYSQVLWAGEAGYSDLAIAANGQICTLFEHGCDNYFEHIVFTSYNLTWLTGGADTAL
jgi:sialidase-1